MKLVVSADLHLKPKTWKHREVKGDSYFAFSFIIRHAISIKADAVLLAGDIFDSTRPEDETVAFFLNEVAKASPIPIFTIQGNHDRASRGWPTVSPMLTNITNLDGEIVTLSSGLLMTGFDFCFRDELLAKLDFLKNSGRDISIVMLHTHLEEAFPIGNPQLKFDELPQGNGPRLYVLGDIHRTFHHVSPDRQITAIYPGVTYPSRVDEDYPKNFMEVTVGADKDFHVNIVPLPSRPVHRPIVMDRIHLDQFVNIQVAAIRQQVNAVQRLGLPADIAKPIIEVKFSPNDEIRTTLERVLSEDSWCHYSLIPIAEEVQKAALSTSQEDTFESAIMEVMGDQFNPEIASAVKLFFNQENTSAVIAAIENKFGIDRSSTNWSSK